MGPIRGDIGSGEGPNLRMLESKGCELPTHLCDVCHTVCHCGSQGAIPLGRIRNTRSNAACPDSARNGSRSAGHGAARPFIKIREANGILAIRRFELIVVSACPG